MCIIYALFLVKHQARFDQVVLFIYSEMLGILFTLGNKRMVVQLKLLLGKQGISTSSAEAIVILPRRIAASTIGVVVLLLLRVFANFIISFLTNFVHEYVSLSAFQYLYYRIEVS